MTDSPTSAPEPKRRPRRALIASGLIAATAAVSLTAGWLLATTFQSPAQIEAQSQPPPASIITAPVEYGDLSRSISVRARVAYTSQASVVLSSDAAAVVTGAPLRQGDTAAPGQVVAEINGNPVFLLPGAFPYYRDIRPGDTGPDVTAFQRGLISAGFDVDADGVFGARTRAGLEWLYKRGGYPAPLASDASEQSPSGAAVGETRTNRPPSTQSNRPSASAAESDPTQPSAPPTARVPYLPRSAVAVAPALPAVVTAAPGVGAVPADGSVLGLASGEVRVVASVTPDTATQITRGGSATIANLGTTAEVSSVGTVAKDDGTVDVELSVADDALKAEVGRDVLVDLVLGAPTDKALIVPTRAVIIRGDTAVVRVLDGNGTTREVAVSETASALGRSMVDPTTPDSLKEGDAVIVQ